MLLKSLLNPSKINKVFEHELQLDGKKELWEKHTLPYNLKLPY
jgi:hypothetical protein